MRSAGVFHVEEAMRGYFGRIHHFRHFTLQRIVDESPTLYTLSRSTVLQDGGRDRIFRARSPP